MIFFYAILFKVNFNAFKFFGIPASFIEPDMVFVSLSFAKL